MIFKCQISFTEIYKENVYDLLDPLKKEKSIEQWTPVQVYEGENGIILKNVNVYEIDTEEEALNLFFMGNTNRITSSTIMNSASSRSHAIFSIIIESEGIKGDRTIMSSGKINFVDLAGSERMYKSNNSKTLIDEAKSINLALHYLEQVIVSLRDEARLQTKTFSKTKSGHIPYRNSLLTSMLRDSLGGNCQSCFILTISPERINFEESISTLRFGQRCGEIKLKVSANTMVGLPDQLKELTIKIKGLEKQLHAAESQKQQVLEDLDLEKSKRRFACEPRTLSNDEKLECKICVQNLLAAAKDAIDNPDDESDDTNRAIIEKSQEDLYDALEKMDKPILIELCSALGGLVQSMYLEREKAKRKQRKEAKQDLMMRDSSFDISSRATRNQEIISLNDVQFKMITTGSTFMKFGRFGMKNARFVYVTEDLKNICWRHIGTNSVPTSFPLRNFQSATVDRSLVKADSRDSCLIVIAGRYGNRSLHLEYACSVYIEENRKAEILWSDCIHACILREESVMKIKPQFA